MIGAVQARPRVARGGRASAGPAACVMGDMELVRPLGQAGIRSVAMVPPGDPTRFSRFVVDTIDDPGAGCPAERVRSLAALAATRGERPVLFFENDRDLLFASRHRDELEPHVRLALAAPELVEDLVDKARFASLAERLGLPLPASAHLSAGDGALPGDLGTRFPAIVKPVCRDFGWLALDPPAKGIEVDGPGALRELWPALGAAGIDVLVQELVPGPEDLIESYHAYVDPSGVIAGEFTGRKIRTQPPRYGYSTSLATTDAADVAELGRDTVERIGLRGVAKLDFKRTPRGELRLLEINPRFSIWHHLGARAGVNIPALVHADLTGAPRPPVVRARAGLRWCSVADRHPARSSGVGLHRWLLFMARCDAHGELALDDPLPFLRGTLLPRLRRRLA